MLKIAVLRSDDFVREPFCEATIKFAGFEACRASDLVIVCDGDNNTIMKNRYGGRDPHWEPLRHVLGQDMFAKLESIK